MLDSYKVCFYFIVLSLTVCTVEYVCLFCEDQISMYFISFLSMIIYEVLYTWCLRRNVCSAWFLDIKISTFSVSFLLLWITTNKVVYIYIVGMWNITAPIIYTLQPSTPYSTFIVAPGTTAPPKYFVKCKDYI